MAKGREITMNLPTADDLFSTQAERDEVNLESVRNIALEEISDFPNHPFKVRMDESMQDMAESVNSTGYWFPHLSDPSRRAVMRW